MTAKIVIDVPGFCTTVQDAGRVGHQGLGVPLSGAMDRLALAAANALVGNRPDAAALEVSYAGPSFEVQEDAIRIALVGGDALLRFSDGRIVRGNRSVRVRAGEKVAVQAPRNMPFAILAIAGGIDIAPVLNSRSTYARGEFGGVEGRMLRSGDILRTGPTTSDVGDVELAGEVPYDQGPIRVVLGPQADYFDAENIQQFFASDYEVMTDSDRMGMRLTGVPLRHARGYDIVTDGVVNGSIQIAGSGLPLILLSDRQTVGGYPKIATVISSDLPRLAMTKPGQKIEFRPVALEEAIAARRLQAEQMNALLRTIRPVRNPGFVNIELLHSDNLISGVAVLDQE